MIWDSLLLVVADTVVTNPIAQWAVQLSKQRHTQSKKKKILICKRYVFLPSSSTANGMSGPLAVELE